ncbi:MAG: phosphoribosyl-AMP cyclohydrolase [Cyanobacteriota bacterium]
MILANQKTAHWLLAAPVASALILTTPHASFAFQVAEPLRMDTNINEAQVLQAQKAWCAGLLSISQAYSTGGFAKAKATANQVLDQAYAYQYGPVAFKPTLTTAPQTFRATKAGALAYFVGGDPSYPNDKGFAIKPWKSCEVRNQVIQLHGMFATTMGNVDLTDPKGAVTTVDKTWTFIREPDSSIRIVLHHSSLPFSAAK